MLLTPSLRPLVTRTLQPWELGTTDPEHRRLRYRSHLSQRITDFTLSRNRVSLPGKQAWRQIKRVRGMLQRRPLECLPVITGPDVVYGPDVIEGEKSTALPFTTGGLADLDGDLGVAINPENGRVRDWADQFGLGNNADQSTAANQPGRTLENANANGHGSVNGDASNFWMAQNGVGTALSGDDVPWFLLIVLRFTQTGVNDCFWALDDLSASAPWHRLFQRADDQYRSWRDGDSGSSTIVEGGTVNTSQHILEVSFPGTSSSLRLDGSVIASGGQDNPTATGIDSATLFANRPSGVATQHCSCELERVSAFSTIPSDPNNTINREFASDIYGVAVS